MEGLYLLNGDDEFAKTEYLNNIKSTFTNLKKGINFLQFDKDNLYGLSGELTTYSFFQEPKLIVVNIPKAKRSSTTDEEAEEEEVSTVVKSTNDWYSEELEDSILNKIENITLVFIEEGKPASKISKFIAKNGKVISFEKKKPNELVSWLVAYSLSQGANMTRDVAAYFIEVCGSDKRTIVNELEKLISYVDNKEIKKEDIDKICTVSSEIIIFNLTDNMGLKKKKQALNDLEDLLSNKEPIQKILVMITRHFKSLLLAKECIEQSRDIQTELALKSSYPAMKYRTQVQNYTKKELLDLFKELARLDIASKTSLMDIKIGLQKIIINA